LQSQHSGRIIMRNELKRREFVQLTLAGSALCLAGSGVWAFAASPNGPKLVSPGCRKTKVKVARLYLGDPQLTWSLSWTSWLPPRTRSAH
jgi:hypothetical protein